MKDYSDKSWLRPTRGMLRRLVALLWDMLIVLLLLIAIGYVIQRNEARAATGRLMLLETSMQPASMDECERTTGKRPDYTVSKQSRTGEPWHHRICGWNA